MGYYLCKCSTLQHAFCLIRRIKKYPYLKCKKIKYIKDEDDWRMDREYERQMRDQYLPN
jgi:hypothetical protein